MNNNLILRTLQLKDEAAFFHGLNEWQEKDRGLYTFDWKPGITFEEHLLKLEKNTKGEDLEEDYVPSTMLYGFVDGVIVGRLHIRHVLNWRLKISGGHIGYAVAEKYRCQGYASEMLKQALPICKKLGISECLLTCDVANHASIKVIERCDNWKLESVSWDGSLSRFTRKYWIPV